MASGYRLAPGEVPAYLAAYLRYPQLPPRCLADLAREGHASPGMLTLADARETAACHGLEVRVRRVAGRSYITFCEPGVTVLPVLSYPAGAGNAFHGPSAIPVAVINSYLFTYRRSVPANIFAPPGAAPRDWARRVTQLTPHMVDEGGYFIRAARDHLTAALAAARNGNAEEAARLLSQAESATPPLTPSPERDAELPAVIAQHTARYGHIEDPASYMSRAVPALLDASDREWEWVRSYISAHPEVRESPAPGDTTAPASRPDEDREGYIATSRRAATAFENGDFEQALTLLDQAELLYPASAAAVARARDKVCARMQQPGTGDAGTSQQQPSASQHTVTPVASPGEPDEAGTVSTAGETTPVTGPEQHRAAGPPEGTQPLTAHTGWAGDLRPERLLYADGHRRRSAGKATTTTRCSRLPPPAAPGPRRQRVRVRAAASGPLGRRPARDHPPGTGQPRQHRRLRRAQRPGPRPVGSLRPRRSLARHHSRAAPPPGRRRRRPPGRARAAQPHHGPARGPVDPARHGRRSRRARIQGHRHQIPPVLPAEHARPGVHPR